MPGETVPYPEIEFHGENCFSMMVNFGALERFWTRRGGRFFLPGTGGGLLTIAAAEAGLDAVASAALGRSFTAEIIERSPEDQAVVTWRAARDAHRYSLAEMLAFLRISGCDPAVFRDFFPALLRALRGAAALEKTQVIEASRMTIDRYYHLDESPDLVFKAGSVLL